MLLVLHIEGSIKTYAKLCEMQLQTLENVAITWPMANSPLATIFDSNLRAVNFMPHVGSFPPDFLRVRRFNYTTKRT